LAGFAAALCASNVARCDMSIASLTIDPEIVDITRMDKLNRTVLDNVNKALKLSKDKSAEHMKTMSKEMGLDKLMMGDMEE
jgi:DNA-binding protein YbaB